jgi:phosphate starvation-inducible PhoH-like protein
MSLSEKRKPKGPIKFAISLNEEQKEAKQIVLNSKISVIRGSAGSGKTMLATQIALDLLFHKSVEKIIITRPAVTAGEELGFLPGTKEDKLAPYTAALYDAMNSLYSKDKIEKEIMEGNIEVIPLAFLRGRNFSNCIVVVDEGQNITHSQMELLLGRLCAGAKMIIVGDVAQIDLKDKKQSGFNFLCNNFKEVEGFSVISLKTNHRDSIVEPILKIYADHRG